MLCSCRRRTGVFDRHYFAAEGAASHFRTIGCIIRQQSVAAFGHEMKNRLTIAIAGAGGDGVVLLGSLLQRLAASIGYCGQMPRYYGPQIRGGASAVKLSLDTGQASVPAGNGDIMIWFKL